MSTDPMLTVYQVAARLNCHHGLVRRLIASGKLAASRIGKEWRIAPEALEAFLVRSQPVAADPVQPDGERLPAVPVRRFA